MKQETPADFSKISPTALCQAYFRTFWDIPHAAAISKLVKGKEAYEAFSGASAAMHLIPAFEARYRGTETVVSDLLDHGGCSQALEIASGLSPMGFCLARMERELLYVETDLPDMINMKRNVIASVADGWTQTGNLRFHGANMLDPEQFRSAVRELLPGRRVVICNIGLLSYLDLEERTRLAKLIRTVLVKYGGAWVTPDPAMHNERRAIVKKNWPAQKKIEESVAKKVGRSYEDNSFTNEHDADEFFTSQGFHVTKHAPDVTLRSWKNLKMTKASADKARLDIRTYAKVWVLRPI